RPRSGRPQGLLPQPAGRVQSPLARALCGQPAPQLGRQAGAPGFAGALRRGGRVDVMHPEPIFWRDVRGPSSLGVSSVWMLIHGDFSDGPGTWSDQMRAAAPGHRLLILDRRGCGQSPRGPVPYTIGGDAEDALEVAERAGAPSFHLMGHSYGALVAIEMVRRRPRAVASLHLIEPPYMSLLPHDPDVAAL